MTEESRRKLSNTQKEVWKKRRNPRDRLIAGLLESLAEHDGDSARMILDEIITSWPSPDQRIRRSVETTVR